MRYLIFFLISFALVISSNQHIYAGGAGKKVCQAVCDDIAKQGIRRNAQDAANRAKQYLPKSDNSIKKTFQNANELGSGIDKAKRQGNHKLAEELGAEKYSRTQKEAAEKAHQIQKSNTQKIFEKRKQLARQSAVKPEAKYLRGGKHGIEWKEGLATAKKTGKPQGQWGSRTDLDYASKKASELAPKKTGIFDLPKKHNSVVHFPNGKTLPATKMFLRNNGTGTFHGYPMR